MAWTSRVPGSVAAMINGQRLRVANQPANTPTVRNVLSPENPAQLTRSEFRICSLIADGKMPDDVIGALGISPNTYRSHMRAIYLKTGVKGQLELVHMLHQKVST